MSFTAIPIEMMTAPNYWAPLADNRWVITEPSATDLWFNLQISDALGSRPYVPSSATLQVTFQRSDLLATSGDRRSLTSTSRSIVKAATADVDNASLWKIALSASDIEIVVSGTVKFALLEGTIMTTWLQNWVLQKQLTDPGF